MSPTGTASYLEAYIVSRDAVDQSLPCEYIIQRIWANGDAELLGSYSEPFVAHSRFRGDLIQSDHHTPTKSRALRWTCTPESVNYLTTVPVRAARPNGSGGIYWTSYRDNVLGVRRPSTVELGLGRSQVSVWDTPYPVWIVRQTRGKVLEALIDSEVNVGQFLGELPESVKSMTKNVITVLQALNAARRGNPAGVAKALGVKRIRDTAGSAADVWFSYKFGWLPMIQDTYNMHSAVSKQLNRPEFAKVTRVHEIEQPADFTKVGKTFGTVKYGCKIGVSYRVANSTLAGLNSLGLVNPASIAWALMPMSFVVDWFLPIGSFLDQLSAPLGLEFLHGYETRYAATDARVEYNAYNGYSGKFPRFKVNGKSFDRVKLLTWPKPSLVVDLGVNPSQLATALGLLSQRVR